MVPMTASLVLLCGAAIITTSVSRWPPALGATLAGLALLASVASTAHDAIGIVQGAVSFNGSLVDEVSTSVSGWPAPNTAVSLGLIAIGLVIAPRTTPGSPARHRVIASLATIALTIAVFTIVGYVYGVDTLRGLPGYLSMALSTAICIVLLSLALLIQSRGGDSGRLLQGSDAGAILARLALPAMVLLPLALGALKIIGERRGWFGPTMGTAVRTIAEMVLFAALATVAVVRLRRLDHERERSMEEERHARAMAQEAHALLEEHSEALEEQAQELEEQAQELETTVDDLRIANESVEAQRAIAEAARAAEASAKNLLDAVVDQLPVGIVLAKVPSGEVVRRNRMGEEIVAALNRGGDPRRGDVVWYRDDGTPYHRSDHPLNRTIRTGEVVDQEELTTQLGDGAALHVSVSSAPVIENGDPVMAVAVFADVSQRRVVESTLAEREALLASFFRAPDVMISVIEADVSPEALARPDVDYRFLLTNPKAAAVFGKTDAEMVRRSATDLGIDAARRRDFVELLAEAHRTGRPAVVERPGFSLGNENTITWLSVVVSPMIDQAGRTPRFCLITTDVSQQRRLEEELRQSQKLEAVGRLAGGVAHDFNNLLTAITGFTRFALSDVPPDSTVRGDLDQALLAAERAAVLTHQLLAFSRQQVLQPQVLDLNQVVANIQPMLVRVIGEDMLINQSLASSLAKVRADRGQIEQVLVNLVVNARDAMPNGGTLTIETADVELDAAQAAATHGGSPGPHVMLAVTDTGMGMSPETRDRIFEPFFTTKETGRGTGLGLATVFGIVRQSGGGIWVYSEQGHGTTFKIYLPRYEGPVDIPRPATPVPLARGSGRVLLVEDDPAVRTIAARVLRSGGFEVTEATTGNEGLQSYRALGGRVDLVLTDLVLPEMGGRAMIQALGKEGPTPPVVYMSGYTAEAMSAQSVLEPGDQFVEKPFTPESLLARVRDTLQAASREPRRVG
jgi:PAS domain S-box-containing protein